MTRKQISHYTVCWCIIALWLGFTKLSYVQICSFFLGLYLPPSGKAKFGFVGLSVRLYAISWKENSYLEDLLPGAVPWQVTQEKSPKEAAGMIEKALFRQLPDSLAGYLRSHWANLSGRGWKCWSAVKDQQTEKEKGTQMAQGGDIGENLPIQGTPRHFRTLKAQG